MVGVGVSKPLGPPPGPPRGQSHRHHRHQEALGGGPRRCGLRLAVPREVCALVTLENGTPRLFLN
jgi:hypothetical protein